MSYVSWSEIEAFHQVRRTCQKYPELLGGRNTVRYRAKVKLHGTNAAVQVRKGKVLAQSRTQIIGAGNDNFGFAAWVEKNAQEILESTTPGVIVFGEWCGQGIMSGCAIHKIEKKVFAVFAAQLLDDPESLIVDPEALESFTSCWPDTVVIPWHGEAFDVSMLDESEVLEKILDERVNPVVAEVEREDPFVKELFDVSGIGEGLVYYPISHCSRKGFADLAFKAKGTLHKVVRTKNAAQVDPEKVVGAEAFADLVLAEGRLEQGLSEGIKGEEPEMKLIGPFLAWVVRDVQKECAAELEASGLTWKEVQKKVSVKAREWFMARIK